MDKKKIIWEEDYYEGVNIGNVGTLFGIDSTIEIEDGDLRSKNITLIINGGQNSIKCSEAFSKLIREKKLNNNINEIKKHTVYKYDNGTYATIEVIESVNDLISKKDDIKEYKPKDPLNDFSDYMK